VVNSVVKPRTDDRGPDSKQMRVRLTTYRAVTEMAAREKRTIVDELDVLVRRGIEASTPEKMMAEFMHARS
jgi:hypothetical protein